MIKLDTMLQLLDNPEQSKRGLLAVEEPMAYAQPSIRDIMQTGLVHLKLGSVLLVCVNLDTSSFGLIHTHTHT
jgi:hypothetical protein